MDQETLGKLMQYKDLAFVVFSFTAFVISIVGLLTSRRALRTSRNVSDPYIVVEVAQYDHSPEGECAITVRNIGSSDAHNIVVRLYRDRDVVHAKRIKSFAKPFITTRFDYVQRGCAEDLIIPRVGNYIDDGNQMTFPGAFYRCKYNDRGGKVHRSEMRVRGNDDPSPIVLEIIGRRRDETERHMREELSRRGRAMPDSATRADLIAEMGKPPSLAWIDQVNLSSADE